MRELFSLLTIFGGVALIVFGMRYLRKGLDGLFGGRLSTWMQRIGARRGWAFLAGVGASVLAPSSTTMSLLAVQTVQAGNLTAAQMLSIVLGANIGLTVMVLLIGLNLQAAAPILLLVGVVLFQFTGGNRSRGVGRVILAVAFILLAIGIMKQAAAQIDPEQGTWRIVRFDVLQQHPLLLAIFGGIMTMLLQSSTAVIGLTIGLGAAGRMNLVEALPVVIGANVGLALTTLVVAWRLLEPRRLAVANLLLKAAVALPALGVVAFLSPRLPTEATELSFGLAIAACHTGFNVLVAAIGLPAVGVTTSLVGRLAPVPPPGTSRAFGPRYIARGPIGPTALAMAQSQREIAHVSEIVRGMLQDIWQALRTSDDRLARRVAERDDQVDLLDTEIKRFLTRLARSQEGEFDPVEQMRQLRYLTELETIGDIIDKNISELVVKKVRLGATFSREGAAELDDFYGKVCENVVIAENAFTTRERILAQQLLRNKDRIDQYERELRDRHFTRLNAGLAEAYETSAIHLDLLTHLRRINSSVSHVAFAILQDTGAPAAAGSAPLQVAAPPPPVEPAEGQAPDARAAPRAFPGADHGPGDGPPDRPAVAAHPHRGAATSTE
jgi:phosphate:Na+ symporter